MSWENQFKTPYFTDVAPQLAALFKMTLSGQPLPFAKRIVDEEEVELARGTSENGSLKEQVQDISMPGDMSMLEDMDNIPPMDEDRPDISMQEEQGYGDLDLLPQDDLDMDLHNNVDQPDELDELRLDAVNDFSGVPDETELMAMSASGHHKWHPHTAKVLGFLRQSMQEEPSTSYGHMTRNTKSRRTAAACFFEILQLKTLNFIDVNQSLPYGDIQVTPSERFHEHVPILDA